MKDQTEWLQCANYLRPVQKAIIEKVGNINPGVYLSDDQILRRENFRGAGGRQVSSLVETACRIRSSETLLRR